MCACTWSFGLCSIAPATWRLSAGTLTMLLLDVVQLKWCEMATMCVKPTCAHQSSASCVVSYVTACLQAHNKGRHVVASEVISWAGTRFVMCCCSGQDCNLVFLLINSVSLCYFSKCTHCTRTQKLASSSCQSAGSLESWGRGWLQWELRHYSSALCLAGSETIRWVCFTAVFTFLAWAEDPHPPPTLTSLLFN